MTQRHKHADLIIAWANNPSLTLQVRVPRAGRFDTEWCDVKEPPMWNENLEYRIKPEPKPDLTVKRAVVCVGGMVYWNVQKTPNVALTFDGETGALKDLEILK